VSPSVSGPHRFSRWSSSTTPLPPRTLAHGRARIPLEGLGTREGPQAQALETRTVPDTRTRGQWRLPPRVNLATRAGEGLVHARLLHRRHKAVRRLAASRTVHPTTRRGLNRRLLAGTPSRVMQLHSRGVTRVAGRDSRGKAGRRLRPGAGGGMLPPRARSPQPRAGADSRPAQRGNPMAGMAVVPR